VRRRPQPIPFYWWPIWMTMLALGLILFYGILTPFWMAIRGIAWVSEHSFLRGGKRAL
jgi:hypothetical protein